MSARPMKDTGIEWIGQIPADWEVRRLAGVSERVQTGPFGSQLHAGDYVDGGVPIINPSHLSDGSIRPDVSVSPATAARLQRHRFEVGDVVFGRRGELGRCAVVSAFERG